ncbi:MAG: hypothetical protein A4E52_00787 [Pelotomaculum sp. PtaB.Bin013]|uniref:DUF4157 domain-containing protein n=1 Tax=Pelotomaculum isophthalicicum JI TaxID=947010 RepID=A0A9X4JW97_9FIRM|nr:DUF4157 domain-containing protein [Pelotomaculum isophthalicicum]MDF9409746.1 DUF4157 domain-containing protein [Pelotomaculum isophthalicicum JI]OPX90583.1 MAG: hypothetical protein A4E52_00787 [Pelotomaculum sp. PtaB.Bin013]
MLTQLPKTDFNNKHDISPEKHKTKNIEKESLNEKNLLHDAVANSGLVLTPANILQLQRIIGNHAVAQFLKQQFLQPVQRVESIDSDLPMEDEDAVQMAGSQRQDNNTGMPDHLKAGIETLSGLDLSDVHVHRNSDKPPRVGALAYTQGSDIFIAPGQEQHLPHEAWHAVQQKQGRVQPTTQAAGLLVNDEPELENEADVMGEKALQTKIEANGNDLRYQNANHLLLQAKWKVAESPVEEKTPVQAVWTLNKENAVFVEMTKAEQDKFDEFQNAINNDGMHPREAAEQIGDAEYENLGGTRFSIRLSRGARAYFDVDNDNQVVTIVRVGDHKLS